MPTTAQVFFLGITADDGTYGSTVNKAVESSPASNSATKITWTTTTVTQKTVIPLAANSAAGNSSDANGWGINNGGADGMGSTASAQRWIKPGVWSFSVEYTLNSPALLASISCSLTAYVYRVSASGTRTLLFSATSSTFSASGTAGWSSASQPEFVLAANEVILVGFTATSASTAALVLGANTNTVLTFVLGASTNFQVPSPGVRTLAIGGGSAAGSVVVDGELGARFSAAGAAAGVGTVAGSVSAIAGLIGAAQGVGNASGVGASRASAVGGATGLGTASARITGLWAAAGAATGSGVAAGVETAIFSAAGASAGACVADGRLGGIASMVGVAAGVADAQGRGSSVSGAPGAAVGSAAVAGRMGAVVGTVGSVDIGGGGSTVVNNYRPIFVFDD